MSRILFEFQSGSHWIVAFLTAGSADGTPSAIRQRESTKWCKKLGFEASQILWTGPALEIFDGTLFKYLKPVWPAIHFQVASLNPRRVYAMAWEERTFAIFLL